MNERTIKLYEEAMEFAYETIGKEHSGTAFFQGAIAGKLAELIVKECAKAIREDAEKFPQGDLTWISAMQESARVVTKHFGVEE